jgi:hypothetical protein
MKQKALTSTIILMALVASFTGACLSSGRDRGSLSGAMEKSRDDHEGDRTVPDGRRDSEPDWDFPDFDDDDDDRWYSGNDSDEHGDMAIREPVNLDSTTWVSVRGSSDPVTTSDIAATANTEILIGLAFKRSEIYLYCGAMVAFPREGSDLAASVEGMPTFVEFGLETRFKLFEGNRALNPWIGLGIGGFVMFWEFRNPLISGSDTITNDFLEGLKVSGGLGIYPVQTNSFRLGVNLMPEFYIYELVTYEGFDNDFFDPFFSVRLGVELSFGSK